MPAGAVQSNRGLPQVLLLSSFTYVHISLRLALADLDYFLVSSVSGFSLLLCPVVFKLRRRRSKA